MEVGNSEKPAKQGYSLSQISLVAALVEGIIVFFAGRLAILPRIIRLLLQELTS